LLIPAAGKLYTVDVSQHTPVRHIPSIPILFRAGALNMSPTAQEENKCELAEIRSEVSGARMDAKFCPYDPNIVSFVR
jgi:hypothetical protein